jgi:hypothetical protein
LNRYITARRILFIGFLGLAGGLFDAVHKVLDPLCRCPRISSRQFVEHRTLIAVAKPGVADPVCESAGRSYRIASALNLFVFASDYPKTASHFSVRCCSNGRDAARKNAAKYF